MLVHHKLFYQEVISMHTDQDAMQQINQLRQDIQWLIQQTQQGNTMYQQMMQQEQQNAAMCEQLAQRERQAVQTIQMAMQGHSRVLQCCQQMLNACSNMEQEVRGMNMGMVPSMQMNQPYVQSRSIQ